MRAISRFIHTLQPCPLSMNHWPGSRNPQATCRTSWSVRRGFINITTCMYTWGATTCYLGLFILLLLHGSTAMDYGEFRSVLHSGKKKLNGAGKYPPWVCIMKCFLNWTAKCLRVCTDWVSTFTCYTFNKYFTLQPQEEVFSWFIHLFVRAYENNIHFNSLLGQGQLIPRMADRPMQWKKLRWKNENGHPLFFILASRPYLSNPDSSSCHHNPINTTFFILNSRPTNWAKLARD